MLERLKAQKVQKKKSYGKDDFNIETGVNSMAITQDLDKRVNFK